MMTLADVGGGLKPGRQCQPRETDADNYRLSGPAGTAIRVGDLNSLTGGPMLRHHLITKVYPSGCSRFHFQTET